MGESQKKIGLPLRIFLLWRDSIPIGIVFSLGEVCHPSVLLREIEEGTDHGISGRQHDGIDIPEHMHPNPNHAFDMIFGNWIGPQARLHHHLSCLMGS